MKSRMKYAVESPEEIIPTGIFNFYPQICSDYRLVARIDYLDDLMIFSESINATINKMKDLLIHSFVVSHEGNWLYVTQVEAYYHEEKIDDVAQNDSHFSYADRFQINFKKCEMGRDVWYELRFRYKKIEFIATGGIAGGSTNFNAFFDVASLEELVNNIEYLRRFAKLQEIDLPCVQVENVPYRKSLIASMPVSLRK